VLRTPFLLVLLLAASLPAAEETRLRLFAPAWRDIGTQRPQDVARKFTIIYGHLAPGPFHEGNPESRIIKYSLGPYVLKNLLNVLAPEALARDGDGKIIQAREFPNWLIVPDNPKWLAHQADMVRRLMDSDFDGLFVDSMGTAPVETGYLEARPINPATGRPYTAGEWLAAESKMMQATVDALPKGKLLFLNGLGPGTRYWREPESDSPRALLGYVHGAMSESIWRAAKAPIDAWPSVENWRKDIRMIEDVSRRGLYGFWWTKCWTDGNTSNHEPGAEVLVPQWRRFALASYLLAAGPRSYFSFDTVKNDQPKSNAAEYFPEYDAPLGTASGPPREVAGTGVWVRPFSGGLVLVNPGSGDAGPLSPAGAGMAYRVWGEDRTVTAPFVVKAHTGLLLTPNTAP
jgi:hypothetical protein